MYGTFGYPACLFFFAWSAGRIHWIWPTLSAVFFGWGSTLLFLGNLIYLSEAYGKYAASALASSDLCRTFLGAIMPLVSHGLFINLGVDRGCTLLGFISVLFVPIPFLLYKVS
jgi:DHA1 family multidrug resistance protein-like MFS transporter